MLPDRARTATPWIAVAALVLIVAGRFWLAADVPLTDTTEARYGEMARKMVETGDWLVPQHDYGVPYLAKPPLAIWLAAAGIATLGPGDLAPRLLILVVSIAFLAALQRWLARELGPGAAWIGVLVIASSALFFVAMAAVMTDLVLVVCADGALLAWWRRMHGGGRQAELAFFALLGLGLLAKGPLTLVLAGVPILLWAALTGRLREAWQRFDWLRGSGLVTVVALPWYLAAQIRNPDFLGYFLLGEHLGRFLQSDWAGDRYGPVHELPHGAIWLFLVFALLPWSLLGPAALLRARRTLRETWSQRRDLIAFWLIAALTPLLLFTAASNVIFPYALPAVVPIVIAGVALLGDSAAQVRAIRRVAATGFAIVAVFVVSATVLQQRVEAESERPVVELARRSEGGIESLYYWQLRRYSADYYGAGRIRTLRDTDALETLLAAQQPFLLAMKDGQFAALPEPLQARLSRVGSFSKKSVYAPKPASQPGLSLITRR